MSEVTSIDKTTKEINNLFDTVINTQKNCENTIKEIQQILHVLKQLRQGTAQNILSEKLSKTEITDLITKIKAKIKSLD